MRVSLLLLFLCVMYNVCPIEFHFLLFMWFSIDFCWVILRNSPFVIFSGHFIFITGLKHLFTNICSFLIMWLVVFQVSQACNNTDFTIVLDIRILTPFDTRQCSVAIKNAWSYTYVIRMCFHGIHNFAFFACATRNRASIALLSPRSSSRTYASSICTVWSSSR